jgi:predicted Zn-dependent peptidase
MDYRPKAMDFPPTLKLTFARMIPEIKEFPNGIRLVYQYADSPVAHLGLILGAGTRDESQHEAGMAHFLEHMLFKGTKKRKPYHILSRMEDVGGDLNAYTSKEDTALHCSYLREYTPRAMELLADILFNSTFPEKEIKKEKQVILDEIMSYEDSPQELIFDRFEEHLFAGHPLGHNILGQPDTIANYTREDVLRFVQHHYRPDQVVFSFVGKSSMAKISLLIEKHFGHWIASGLAPAKLKVNGYTTFNKIEERETYQSHCLMGTRTFSAHDPRLPQMVLLNNILGGPSLNSRLSLNIRERYGFAYSIDSYFHTYQDCGVFQVYLGTAPGSMEKSIQLVMNELKKLREQPLGHVQLSRAKKQIMGQIALSMENYNGQMLSAGKSLLALNRVDTADQMMEKIERVSAAQLLDLANEVFDTSQMSTLIYKAK